MRNRTPRFPLRSRIARFAAALSAVPALGGCVVDPASLGLLTLTKLYTEKDVLEDLLAEREDEPLHLTLKYEADTFEPTSEHLERLIRVATETTVRAKVTAGPAGEGRGLSASSGALRRARALAPFVAALTGDVSLGYDPSLEADVVLVEVEVDA